MTLSEIRLNQKVRIAAEPQAPEMRVFSLYLQGASEEPMAACEWRKGVQLMHYPVADLEPA